MTPKLPRLLTGFIISAYLNSELQPCDDSSILHTNPPWSGFIRASILTLFVCLVPLGSGSASTPTPLGFTARYSLRSFMRASLGSEKAKLFRFARSLRL